MARILNTVKILCTLALAAVTFIPVEVSAAECGFSGYFFANQDQIDAFGSAAAPETIDCDVIVGSVTIDEETGGAIGNVDALAQVTQIQGDLSIRLNSQAINLDGFINLQTVGGKLNLSNNPELTSLEGFGNLSSVGGSLRIISSRKLQTLTGLEALKSIGGELELYGLRALVTVDALTTLESISGSFTFQDNDKVTSLSSLSNVSQISGEYVVMGNELLTEISGLNNQAQFNGNIQIQANPALNNIDSLKSLTSVTGSMVITNNTSLNHCQSLARLLGFDDGEVKAGAGIFLNFNGPQCTSHEAVLQSVMDHTAPEVVGATIGDKFIRFGFTESATTNTAYPILAYDASCDGLRVQESNNTQADLRDFVEVRREIEVTKRGLISDISVDVDIVHVRPDHLIIKLISPSGTEVTLWDQNETAQQNLVGTFPSTISSSESLTILHDEERLGTWALVVEDVTVGPIVREGVLNSWSLNLGESFKVSTETVSPIELQGLINHRLYTCTVAPVIELGVSTPSSTLYISPRDNIKLRYDTKGGSDIPPTQSGPPLSLVSVSTEQPELTGYDFVNWFLPPNGSPTEGIYAPGDSIILPNTGNVIRSGRITLEAMWALAQPSITRAVTQDGSITLWVSPVPDISGQGVTYIAQCTAEDLDTEVRSMTPKIVVSGLTNGANYNCTVTIAANESLSVVSEATGPLVPAFVPEEEQTPVWLRFIIAN